MLNYKSIYVSIESQSEIRVKRIVDKIISSGKISPQDHALLTSAVFNRNDMSEGERRQINRVFDHIQTGQLKLVQW